MILNKEQAISKAKEWDHPLFDNATRAEVRQLLQAESDDLVDAFYCDLEFGTGGLRGKRGVGTNRINRYTVGMATQGLCNYLRKVFPEKPLRFAIAYDSRHQSPEFAATTAAVCAANGIQVFIFPELRPTPELSFAIRKLDCTAGVMITASHNPPEYNGYKAFWEDGAQVVAPHDQGIISEVRKIAQIDEVNWDGNRNLIHEISSEMDEQFLECALAQCLNKEGEMVDRSFPIVYTALHGTGATLIPTLLKKYGFEHVDLQEEQQIADGDFPTVDSPNPEEAEALTKALDLAEKVGAKIVLGTDPDGDRVGVAARDSSGKMNLLNGNETAALLVDYILSQKHDKDELRPSNYIVSTVVTSNLLLEIAKLYNVKSYVTLTGFKHIAHVIGDLEGKEEFLVGGEESYGYMIGDFVRDKDAVTSSLLISEMAAYYAGQGKTLFDQLETIHRQTHAYKEKLISIKREGIAGKEAINSIMEGFRNDPPTSFAGSELVYIDDLQNGTRKQMLSGQKMLLDIPKSNVIQLYLKDGSKISARPSGTEPKIKFYISVQEPVGESYEETMQLLLHRIKAITEELKVDQF